MRPLLLLTLALTAACARDANLEHANEILTQHPIVDGHNDLPWAIRQDTIARKDVDKYDLMTRARGHTDLERLRAGHVGAQFWSVYIPGDSGAYGYAKMQAEQIAIAKAVVAKYPDSFKWTLTAADIRAAFAEGKIGSLMGVEGGHAIENSLDSLRSYYAQGARYMTLTHNVTLDWADAASDSARHGGLTPFGEEVVREMNRLGMLVDLSHVSPAVMSDALNATEAPVIFSHSSARALTEHVRNVPDSILARLPANGGVVMVTFVPGFVSQRIVEHGRSQVNAFAQIAENAKRSGVDSAGRVAVESAWIAANPVPRATIADVADHIDHVKRIAGVDHFGIGSDFDGIDETVVDLDNVSTFPNLFAELIRRGWTDADLKKLAGENVLRALERAEQVAVKAQASRPASKARIK